MCGDRQREDRSGPVQRGDAGDTGGDLYESIYVRDHWGELTECPWWYAREPDIERQLAWRKDVIAKTGQDWYDHPRGYSRQDRQHLLIEGRDDEAILLDRRTGKAEKLSRPRVAGWTAVHGLQSHHPAQLADTPEAIDLAVAAMPKRLGTPGEGWDDLAEEMLRQFGDDYYPVYWDLTSPCTDLYDIWGYSGMMEMLVSQPELAHYAMKLLLERAIKEAREAAELGAAGVWLQEYFTDQIRPQTFRAMSYPYVAALIEEARGLGLAVFYYFCGDPAGKWDLLFDLQPDALGLEESKKGFEIDIEEVVERARGRCALLGNLDAIELLPHASEPALRAEIARQIKAGRRNGSRFILSLGSPVTPGTSVERVRLYCDLVHEISS